MKTTRIAVCALALLMTSAAYADTASKQHTETTVTRNGNDIERKVTKDSSTDPDGLGNKTWSKDEMKAKMKANGEESESATHKSVDSAGTAHEVDETVSKDVASD